jgi:hypothetical protein
VEAQAECGSSQWNKKWHVVFGTEVTLAFTSSDKVVRQKTLSKNLSQILE